MLDLAAPFRSSLSKQKQQYMRFFVGTLGDGRI